MGDVGGGFGQKAYLARDEQIVMLASYHLGRPLKWIEDRHENLVAATSSRAERCTVTIAADADGKILGIARRPPRRGRRLPAGGQRGRDGRADLHRALPHPEAVVQSASRRSRTRCSRAPYRGPWQFETYFREQAIDSLARAMGIDPLELRRRNVIQPRRASPHPARRHPDRRRVAGGDARAGRGDDRLRRFPRLSSASELAAGRLVGIGIGLYIEPQSTPWGPTAPSPPTSASSPTAASTCTSARDRTARASRPRPRSS